MPLLQASHEHEATDHAPEGMSQRRAAASSLLCIPPPVTSSAQPSHTSSPENLLQSLGTASSSAPGRVRPRHPTSVATELMGKWDGGVTRSISVWSRVSIKANEGVEESPPSSDLPTPDGLSKRPYSSGFPQHQHSFSRRVSVMLDRPVSRGSAMGVPVAVTATNNASFLDSTSATSGSSKSLNPLLSSLPQVGAVSSQQNLGTDSCGLAVAAAANATTASGSPRRAVRVQLRAPTDPPVDAADDTQPRLRSLIAAAAAAAATPPVVPRGLGDLPRALISELGLDAVHLAPAACWQPLPTSSSGLSPGSAGGYLHHLRVDQAHGGPPAMYQLDASLQFDVASQRQVGEVLDM